MCESLRELRKNNSDAPVHFYPDTKGKQNYNPGEC